jgi:DUF1009 family protein
VDLLDGVPLGVIVGECEYFEYLKKKIYGHTPDYLIYSWFSLWADRQFLNPFRMSQSAQRLRDDGVTRVMCAGTTNPQKLWGSFSGIYLSEEERPGLEAHFDNRKRFGAYLRQTFEAAGITLVSIKDVFTEFEPLQRLQDKKAPPTVADRLKEIRDRAILCCSKECNRDVSQAVVFDLSGDGCEKIGVEAGDTEAFLLEDLFPAKKDNVTRVLAKVLPVGWEEKTTDPPTVGPNIVRAAHIAGVDVIALDGLDGAIVDPGATFREAAAHAISIVAF